MPEENQSMKVESTMVTKLTITGADRLDPVSVFLEDFGGRTIALEHNPNYVTRSGKITIECFGESWSAYWGGMGPRTVAQFFTDCNVDYLVGCLARSSEIDREVFDGNALEQSAKRCIIDCRRGRTAEWECGPLDKEEARELFDDADDLSNFESTEGLWHSGEASDLLTRLFGEEWHYTVSNKAFVPHPKRQYLCRIVAAVQQALTQHQQAAAA
ncbi:hypothetical protein [Pseudomonas boanensis]|uniref:hypothetical protein n=1 Tax=Metapseudomonas boanensis TaxID=2822138 RepID=UPI0035D4C48F